MKTFYTHASLGRWPEKASYYLDFILYPTVVGAVTLATCRSLAWCGLAGLGIVLFTFVEYWVHRVILHRFFYHGTHERHHKHPEEYVVFPVLYLPLFFALMFLILPAPIFVGFTLAYGWYTLVHHAVHHWDLSKHPLVARYARWHDMHHKWVRCNFGVTSGVWDIDFCTARGK